MTNMQLEFNVEQFKVCNGDVFSEFSEFHIWIITENSKCFTAHIVNSYNRSKNMQMSIWFWSS